MAGYGSEKNARPILASWAFFAAAVASAVAAEAQTVAITGVAQPSVILIKDGTLLKSEADLSLTSDAAFPAWARITVPGQAAYMESLGNLASGPNTKTVHVAELPGARADVSFQIFPNAAGTGNPLAARTLSQKRIRRWTLYAANDCHVDIGYTHYQEVLKKKLYPAYLDTAFDYIAATASWPAESRFTYPVESAFMISDGSWLSRNADWHETLKGHLRSGRMSYPPGYFNFSTETMSAEELARSNYPSGRLLQDMLGVPPTKAAYMTDNPSMSWSFIDALAESGVKAYRFRFNHDFNKWDIFHYPRLFFLQGRNPANKVLIWNGGHYWDENAQIGGSFGFQGASSADCQAQVLAWFAKLEQEGYAQDAWLATFTSANSQGWVDNSGINPNVMQRIKGINDLMAAQGIAYPKVIASNHGDFFDHILAGDTRAIPVHKGTVESWWNLGVPSTAYETGRNREGQDKLAAAEMFSAFAAATVDRPHPQERLTLAWKNMLTWDEHTWGPADRSAGDQWNWKRNTALISEGTGEDLLAKAQKALAGAVKLRQWSIVVFNPLSWRRDDLVRVPLAELPPRFDIADAATGRPVRYQKTEGGQALFQASGVPGLGYKVYEVSLRTDEPRFTGSLSATGDILENAYFKVTFDAAGNISGIRDKQAGNRELVDPAAPGKFNQLQVNEVWPAAPAVLHSVVGPLSAEMVADGTLGAQGVEAMQRRVILYDSIRRIDIENTVLKADGGDRWDFHFAFPFAMKDHELTHEMPTGSMRPGVSPDLADTGTEQLYTSATDQYAVNRWIDISDGNGYGIAFSPVTAPMVSYGGRRAMSWDVGYNHKDPWIWSQIYNNHWHTNFQAVQPGLTRFRYSFQPHGGKDWSEGDAPRIGAAAFNPLRASVVKGPQDGPWSGAEGSFVGIDVPDVVLTTAKPAEDNGDGMVFRFNEVSGRNTRVTVDLSRFAPMAAFETDLIENDRGPLPLTEGKVSFDIHAYGWKTVRIKRGNPPGQPAGLSAAILAGGCRLAWDPVPGADYYEVFRGTSAGFAAGPGGYMGLAGRPRFFDPQVVPGLSRPYWYRVRAVKAGSKGAASPASQAAAGTYVDRTPPSVPELIRVDRLHGTRASLEWTASEDDIAVAGYEVWRDGQKLLTVDAILNSHLDIAPVAWNEMPRYQVLAFDQAGNRSAMGKARTSGPDLPDWINAALSAAVTVSSEFDAAHGKDRLVDGIYGRQDAGEWAAAGEGNPWARLDWKEKQSIRAIVLHDRSNTDDNVNGGTLTFSDGSSIKVSGIPTWGEARLIAFPWKEVSWVRFQAEGGKGVNGGLAELAALGEDRVPVSIASPVKDARAWKVRAGEGGTGNSNGGRKPAKP
ncbi:MAG: type protein [Fibrobacteres bacterium]|nr:type protein [Fibrobacterota bacterium]